MIFRVSILLAILLPVRIFPQLTGFDTLFNISDHGFHSELERNAISDFYAGQPDLLSITAAINPDTDSTQLMIYRQWIDGMTNQIKNKKFDNLSETKKISVVSKYLANTVFSEYNQTAGFHDLYTSGSYNFFTGILLYSFILDELDIPYQVFETAKNVHLVLYPDSKAIVVKLPVEDQTYFMFDYDSRVQFVQFLTNIDVISDQDLRESKGRDMFSAFFYSPAGLSAREVAGMLYANEILKRSQNLTDEEIYSGLLKSFVLYPSYKIIYILLFDLDRMLQDPDYKNPEILSYLITASKFIGYGTSIEYVKSHLDRMTQILIYENDDFESFIYVYHYLRKSITNPEIIGDLRFRYYLESGKRSLEETEYYDAVMYLETASEIKDTSVYVQNLLIRALFAHLELGEYDFLQEKFQEYDVHNPHINKNLHYQALKAYVLLHFTEVSFRWKDEEGGIDHLKNFEAVMKEYPDNGVSQEAIAGVYSMVAKYYYTEGDLARSSMILKNGLLYAPGSSLLESQMNYLKSNHNF